MKRNSGVSPGSTGLLVRLASLSIEACTASILAMMVSLRHLNVGVVLPCGLPSG